MPNGLLRSMLMAGREVGVWQELEQARWLHHTRLPSGEHRAQLLDATVLTQVPGRARRAQAAGLALCWSHSPGTRAQPAWVQLAAVALTSYLAPASGSFDLADFAHVCALSEEQVTAAMERLGNAGALSTWSLTLSAGELYWRTASTDA
ncbi:hypothetical protein ACFVT6_39955 [Streptomyces sp. NPDC058049]|uniref:hypothetical protein n=1 Tax=Streptomyces sp. NPDC058049 TaxID=3346314 RepID=UPI0036F05694